METSEENAPANVVKKEPEGGSKTLAGGCLGAFFGPLLILIGFDLESSGIGFRMKMGLVLGVMLGLVVGYFLEPKSERGAKGAKWAATVAGLIAVFYFVVVTPALWFLVWIYSPKTPVVASTPAPPVAVQVDPDEQYRRHSYLVLIEDKIEPIHRHKMEPILTSSIKKACQSYGCSPAQFVMAARQLKAAMQKNAPETTLTEACNLFQVRGTSLEEEAEKQAAFWSGIKK